VSVELACVCVWSHLIQNLNTCDDIFTGITSEFETGSGRVVGLRKSPTVLMQLDEILIFFSWLKCAACIVQFWIFWGENNETCRAVLVIWGCEKERHVRAHVFNVWRVQNHCLHWKSISFDDKILFESKLTFSRLI
jgi:hypothetical protein